MLRRNLQICSQLLRSTGSTRMQLVSCGTMNLWDLYLHSHSQVCACTHMRIHKPLRGIWHAGLLTHRLSWEAIAEIRQGTLILPWWLEWATRSGHWCLCLNKQKRLSLFISSSTTPSAECGIGKIPVLTLTQMEFSVGLQSVSLSRFWKLHNLCGVTCLGNHGSVEMLARECRL